MTDARAPIEAAALEAHAAGIRRLVRSLLRDDDRVDDAVQETLLAGLRRRTALRTSLGAWLAGVARRVAWKSMRDEARRRTRHEAAGPREPSPATDAVVSRLEERRRVLDAVAALEEPYRSTIALRFFDGLTPGEVARRTTTPVETVRTRTRRALERLRAALDEDHGGDRDASRRALAALLPAGLGWLGPTVPWVAGGLAVKKLAVAAAVLFALAAGWFVVDSIDVDAPRDDDDAAPRTAAAPAGSEDAEEAPRDVGVPAVSGRVREGGSARALPGVRVRLFAIGTPRDALATTTDADGAYAFASVPAGRWLVVPSSPDHYVRELARHPGPGSARNVARREPPPPASLVLAVRNREPVVRDLELWPGFVVRGRVVTPDDRPVSGAAIEPYDPERRPFASWGVAWPDDAETWARSDADGRFVARGRPPAAGLTLIARRAGLVGRPSAPVAIGEGIDPAELRLVVEPGATLRGVVHAGDDRPLAGVRITLEGPDARRGSAPGSVESGTDGAFEIAGVASDDDVALVASADGWPTVRMSLGALRAGEVREGIDVRFAGGHDLVGVLVDEEGVLAPGVTVQLRAPRVDGRWHETRSGDDGVFRFHGVADGLASLETPAAPGRPHAVLLEAITVPAEEPIRAVVVLGPRWRVVGRVTDDAERPVASARVVATSWGETGRPRPMRRPAATTAVADGTFELRFRGVGPMRVVVDRPLDAAGAPLGLAPWSTILDEPGEHDLVVVLGEGARVHGVVRTTDGRPVPGATVRVWGSLPGGDDRFDPMVRAEDVATTTDDEGRFEATLADGPVQVVAVPPRGLLPSETVRGFAGGEEIVVTVRTGGSIAGRVIDEADQPVLDGRVTVEWARTRTRAGGRRSVAIAGDGRFFVDRLPEGAVVSVRAESREPDAQRAPALVESVRVGTQDLVLRLGAGVEIRGRIVDAEGEPFVDCIVAARHRRVGRLYAWARPDESGAFTIRVPEAGPYEVRGMRGFSITAPLRVDAPAADLRLVVVDRESPNGKPIAGRVTYEDGKPARSGWVHASWGPTEHSRGGRHSASIRPDGTFRTTPIPADVTVAVRVVTADADRLGETAPLARGGIRPGETDLELVLPAGVRIEGVALDEDGRPLAGVAVRVSPADGGPAWAAAPADEKGRFVVVVGAPGEYDVRLFRNTALGPATRVTAPARDVTIRLERQSLLMGRAVGAGGPVLSRAWPSGGDRRSPSVVVRSDDDGHFAIPLPPDDGVTKWSVEAWTTGDTPTWGRADPVRPGTEVEVRLAPARAISGRVVGPDGEPLGGRGRFVYARSDARVAGVRLAADGTFRIGTLPPGDYRLEVVEHVAGSPARTLATVEGVAAGATGVEIRAAESR